VAERDPAASFFQPQSIVQQQNNNDGNSYGIVDSAYVEGATKDNANHDGDGENNDDEQLNNSGEHNENEDKAVTIDFDTDSASTNITHSDIAAVLDVEEGEDDGRDEDDVDEDEDGSIINNNKYNEGTTSEGSVMREVLEAVQTTQQQNDNDGSSGDVVDSACVEGATKDGGDEENNDDEHHLNNNVEHNQNEDEAVTINIGTDLVRYITHINDAIATMHATANVISLDAEWNVTLNRNGYPTNTGKLDNENSLLPQ